MCGAGFSVTINGKLYTFEGSVSGLPEETEKCPKLELAAYRKNPYKQPLQYKGQMTAYGSFALVTDSH